MTTRFQTSYFRQSVDAQGCLLRNEPSACNGRVEHNAIAGFQCHSTQNRSK